MDELRHLTAQMAREGVRRLLVLSGDDAWTLRQAQRVRTALAGDGLWVGPRPMPEPYVSSAALKSSTPFSMPARVLMWRPLPH